MLLYIIPNAWRSEGENDIGTNTSAGLPLRPGLRGGNTNESGMMPTTVYGRPSSEIVLPTSEGSRPNVWVHRLWLTSATLAPCRSSSSVRARPIAGPTPRTANSPGNTRAPSNRCGVETPESSSPTFRYAANPEYDLARSRTISKSGGEKPNLIGTLGSCSNSSTSRWGS